MDFATRQTRGSGFIRFAEYQSAADAVAALHQSYTFPGGPAGEPGAPAGAQVGSQLAVLQEPARPPC